LTLLPTDEFPVAVLDEEVLRFIPAASASCSTAETDFPNRCAMALTDICSLAYVLSSTRSLEIKDVADDEEEEEEEDDDDDDEAALSVWLPVVPDSVVLAAALSPSEAVLCT
jgi:hypothetical protein